VALLDECLRLFEEELTAAGDRDRTTVQKVLMPLPPVLADRDQLQWLLGALLRQAQGGMPGGGSSASALKPPSEASL